ncbi:MAG: formate dehydrogenase accessory sulfurtransferase FdhD, partial [Dehalococcoidia bacterium]
LKSKDEVETIAVCEQEDIVRVETKEDKETAERLPRKQMITCGGGRLIRYRNDASGRGQVTSQFSVPAAQVLTLVRQFQRRSQIFKATGGVHSAALCDERDVLVFSEDIGRHNAIDNILGRCLLESQPTANRILITSGRVSSEIVLKVASMDIPILVSPSAPTDLGVRLASDLGLTLVGFARGDKMNVYANGWRIASGEEAKTRQKA